MAGRVYKTGGAEVEAGAMDKWLDSDRNLPGCRVLSLSQKRMEDKVKRIGGKVNDTQARGPPLAACTAKQYPCVGNDLFYGKCYMLGTILKQILPLRYFHFQITQRKSQNSYLGKLFS